MRITPVQKTITLDAASIDAFSDQIEMIFAKAGIERQNRLRTRLSIEEALLRMRDRFGEEKEVQTTIGKRFGSLTVQVDVEGDPFNPLSGEETELEDLCSSLLTSVGLSPQYTYTGRVGTLRVSLPLPGMNPVIKILVAIIGGILIGLIGNGIISDAMRSRVISLFSEPIYIIWGRILNVMSGPVIFFMVITTILNTNKITERGGSSRRLIWRYFYLSFLMGALAIVIAWLRYPLQTTQDVLGGKSANGLFHQIQQIMPENVFDPFMESNTPQLLLIAFVLGALLNFIGSRVNDVKRVVRQINMAGLQLCDWVSRLVPYFACILIGLEIWEGRTSVLFGLWHCLLLALLISLGCILISFGVIALQKKVSMRVLFKKVWGPFWLTMKYGSLDAAYGQIEQCCATKLGIAKPFTKFSLPNGLVLYMPISAIGTLVFMVYAARSYGVSASPVWYVQAVILSVVLFVATPPVPGANLLAYVALFARLGIPGEALVDAMIFDIIFGIFAAASNELMLQMELILQADKLGMLNQKRLQKGATRT